MSPTRPDVGELAARLACCGEGLDAQDQRAHLVLFRLLAHGRPVEPAWLAERMGFDGKDLATRLDRWHGIHTDEGGRIVAFQGLSLVETPHRLRVEGRTVYAWCAWDTLFLPELIGRPAEIESACRVTGEPISLRVGSSWPGDVSPPGTVLSLLLPGSTFRDDVIGSFCRFVHFFASPRAAGEWTAEHRGTFAVSIEDGYEIGRRTNGARYGQALGAVAA
jgi:alkylmercury lyase